MRGIRKVMSKIDRIERTKTHHVSFFGFKMISCENFQTVVTRVAENCSCDFASTQEVTLQLGSSLWRFLNKMVPAA